MYTQEHRFTKLAIFSGDLLLLNACFIAAGLNTGAINGSNWQHPSVLVFLAFFNVAWFVCTAVLGTYRFPRTATKTRLLREVTGAVLLHLCSVCFYIVVTESFFFNRQLLLQSYVAILGGLSLWWLLARLGTHVLHRLGLFHRRVIIIGNNSLAQQLAQFFTESPQYGYSLLGSFAPEDLRQFYPLRNLLKQQNVQEIYYTASEPIPGQLKRVLKAAGKLHIPVKLVPDFDQVELTGIEAGFCNNLPIITLRKEPLDYQQNLVYKRVFDIAFSSVFLLLVGIWLFPLIALCIKLNSRGPVFFLQKRSGRNGSTFNCLKFRTMVVHNDHCAQQATRNDPRITSVGAFLRKTSLDELPQFINVFLGQMSIVGPRPHPLALDNRFENKVENYLARHLCKPGITGLAQARGFRGETPDVWSMKSRVRLDLFYITNWSFYLDMKIIFLTVSQVMNGHKNAY